MLKKALSLTALAAVLVTSVSCGSTTTSMYSSTETLGRQISNNINKIVNDAERGATKVTTGTTYNNGNRIYTNNNKGYANTYTRLNSDYNYNGVALNNNTMPEVTTVRNSGRMQANLNNLNNTTVRKSNTMTSIPSDRLMTKNEVKKSNTITNMPVTNNAMQNSETINRVLNTTNVTVDNTINGTVGSQKMVSTTGTTPTNVADTSVSPVIIARG